MAPREIFKYSRSVFAWTTISRGVEHTRLVYHHAWLLHARLLHAWPLHAWLLHTWLAITRVAGYYTRGWLLHAWLAITRAAYFYRPKHFRLYVYKQRKQGRYTYERLAHCVCTYYVVSFIFSATVRQFLAWTMDL